MTIAHELMVSYAARTGLVGSRAPRRYLWTDAFAVCNFLALGEAELAVALVDRVHHVLGRQRDDGRASGWLSGLSEAEGEAHPTLGGLRIGKPLPERPPGHPIDERLEWERDGQYFHYLTKWMFALDRVAAATGDAKYLRWALELADVAHRRFVHVTHGHMRMYWKLSIDLTRPQVGSMGQHDPLDGYVTALELATSASRLAVRGPDLSAAIADYRAMIDPSALATTDALGLGGLLTDADRLTRLDRDRPLRDALLAAAERGLSHFATSDELRQPAGRRLAFRELGLAIGLAAVAERPATGLAHHARLGGAIVSFWQDEANRRSRTYREHEDINDVMLATALAPEGFLARRPHAA